MKTLKLCIDCRFYRKRERDICEHPRNHFTDPVTGLFVDYEASWLRNVTRPDIETCGMDARWFEAK